MDSDTSNWATRVLSILTKWFLLTMTWLCIGWIVYGMAVQFLFRLVVATEDYETYHSPFLICYFVAWYIVGLFWFIRKVVSVVR